MKNLYKILLLSVLQMITSSIMAAGPQTVENRLIALRNKMEMTKDNAQQKEIISDIAETGTFLGMMYCAEFLDNDALKASAAKAVASMALSHPEYDGTNTRQILSKALPLLKGKEKKGVKTLLKGAPAGEGFVKIFNGRDLSGWKGLVDDPIKRSRMSQDELAQRQIKADESMRQDWIVEDGLMVYVGKGFDNICTVKQYGDFEMYVDWKLDPAGKEPDAGVYLRGTPQVQIWDIARVNVGAQVGSGGLYNNKKNRSTPTEVADNTLGEWNSFYIKMVGDKVTVILNGVKVVDNVVLENYWDRSQPIFPKEQIEMQAHGSRVFFRDIYIKEL